MRAGTSRHHLEQVGVSRQYKNKIYKQKGHKKDAKSKNGFVQLE